MDATVQTIRPADVVKPRMNVHLLLLVVYSIGVVAPRALDGAARPAEQRFLRRRPIARSGTAVVVDAGGQHRCGLDGRRAGLGLSRRDQRVVVGRLGRHSARSCSRSSSRRSCGGWRKHTISSRPATTSSSATASAVRTVVAVVICLGSLALLAGQLIAGRRDPQRRHRDSALGGRAHRRRRS